MRYHITTERRKCTVFCCIFTDKQIYKLLIRHNYIVLSKVCKVCIPYIWRKNKEKKKKKIRATVCEQNNASRPSPTLRWYTTNLNRKFELQNGSFILIAVGAICFQKQYNLFYLYKIFHLFVGSLHDCKNIEMFQVDLHISDDSLRY